jgi:signal transduction histidine kinase
VTLASGEGGESGESESARPPVRFIGRGMIVAMIMVVVASVLRTNNRASVPVGPASMGAMMALGAVYTALGAIGLRAAEGRGDRTLLLAGIGVIGALAIVAVPLSHGEAWFMAMPVLTLAILFLPRAWSRATITLMGTVIAAGVVVYSNLPPIQVLQDIITHGSALAFVVVFSHMTRRHHEARVVNEELARELAEANARLRELAREAHDLATTRERNRIAREIHDGLGHYLTVVFVQLEAAEKLLAKDPERAKASIAKARELTHEGLDEVRRAVAVLRETGSPRRTLVEGLEELASASREAGLDTRLVVQGEPRPLAEPTAFTLYRAAQEALTNVSRHASAHHVRVELAFDAEDAVALRVEDDGVGSDRAEGGFGLVGLRERAELVGGEVRIRTARGQGFALELRVPG